MDSLWGNCCLLRPCVQVCSLGASPLLGEIPDPAQGEEKGTLSEDDAKGAAKKEGNLARGMTNWTTVGS